jgi:threonyl-tRNA synthetase
VAGEQEMKNGTVNIRTRENINMGEMRVDKLHNFF